jgi:hypothetical protein
MDGSRNDDAQWSQKSRNPCEGCISLEALFHESGNHLAQEETNVANKQDCKLCGDSGGYPYCFTCQDMADDMDVDIYDFDEEDD